VVAALIVVAGCSVVPKPHTPEALYDFGPLLVGASAARLDRSLTVHDAQAPSWLDAPAMHYRQAQSAPVQPRNYANSRWVMSPAALFTQRLRSRLAEASRGVYAPADSVRTDLVLRLELEEFVQMFDSTTTSRGQVRVRVSLSAGRDAPVQRTFSVDRPASSADADGGAKALIAASDEAIRQIVEWVSASGKPK
jgi:cholesterol transport system auxiliary component